MQSDWNREAVHLLISTVRTLELDVNDFVVNRSPINHRKERFRSKYNEE